MALRVYGFEGDLENITETQLQFINGVILEKGFKNSKILFEPVGKAGDNYVASVKRITVEGTKGTLKIIAKIAPTLAHIRETMNTVVMFQNEHTMYKEVLPKLVQLQKDADIPNEEQLQFAECYGSFTEEPNEVILLEDLTVSGFTMLDRFVPLKDDSVRSVLKNFAKLHSLSFVLKHKEQETFNKFKNKLIDAWTGDKMDDLRTYLKALEDDTLAILEDPKYIDFARGKVSGALDVSVQCAEIDKTSDYTVIHQGDPWTNNIMFRFEDGNLRESIMIDYQLSKNTSPANDILYMIFNCTDHETRKVKFYDWLDFYYAELETNLSKFDVKVNSAYPRHKLDEDLKQYGKFQFGISVLIGSVLIRNTEDCAKVKDAMNSENILEQTQELLVSKLGEDSKTLFRKRIVGIIESFIEFNI